MTDALTYQHKPATAPIDGGEEGFRDRSTRSLYQLLDCPDDKIRTFAETLARMVDPTTEDAALALWQFTEEQETQPVFHPKEIMRAFGMPLDWAEWPSQLRKVRKVWQTWEGARSYCQLVNGRVSIPLILSLRESRLRTKSAATVEEYLTRNVRNCDICGFGDVQVVTLGGEAWHDMGVLCPTCAEKVTPEKFRAAVRNRLEIWLSDRLRRP